MEIRELAEKTGVPAKTIRSILRPRSRECPTRCFLRPPAREKFGVGKVLEQRPGWELRAAHPEDKLAVTAVDVIDGGLCKHSYLPQF